MPICSHGNAEQRGIFLYHLPVSKLIQDESQRQVEEIKQRHNTVFLYLCDILEMANNGCQGLKLGERLTTDGLEISEGGRTVPGLDCDVWYICQNLQSYPSKRVISWAELTFPELIPSKPAFDLVTLCPQPADGAVSLCPCVSHLSPWHSVPSTGSPTTLG